MRRLWRVAGALGALVLLGFVGWRAWPVGDAAVRPVVRADPPASTADPLAQRAVRSASAAPGIAAVEGEAACPHQALRLTFGGRAEVACVGPGRAVQTGSMRDHAYAAEGTSRWSLRISVAGGHVVAATLGDGGSVRYKCKPCAGLSIAAADRYGVRHFDVADAGLADGSTPAVGTKPSVVHVTAMLRIEPQAPRACSTPQLEIADASGASTPFCPDGGAGFELTDDGRHRYRFDDLDGHTVSVTLDEAGGIREARFGALACAGAACGGLATHGAASTDARSFDFAAVRLLGTDGAVAATLTGRLVMPSQR